MIRTMVFALFGLAVASAAQAMPFSPAYQPDGMITQARMGCGAGRVMVNGVCHPERHAPGRWANRRCARYSGGVCVQ